MGNIVKMTATDRKELRKLVDFFAMDKVNALTEIEG